MRNFLGSILTIAILSLAASSLTVYAAQRDYVEAVEADLEEFSSGTFVSPEGSAWVVGGGDESSPNQTKTLDLESFAAFLKEASPGTYIFYRNLEEDSQKEIWEEYLATGDLERTKKSVFRHANKRR